jgi:hypothetical protein
MDEILGPWQFPEKGLPNRKIVLVDLLRSGQPRPYADHERFYRVIVRYYDYLGNLVEKGPSIEMLKQHALSAVGGDRYVQVGERKHGSLDEHAKTYVESVDCTGSHEVEIMIKEPYID